LSRRDRGGHDGLAQRVVRRAAQHAPPPLTARLQEEWLADLLCRKGPVSRLRFALGCCWAVQLIAHEHCVAPAAASATATAGRGAAAGHARYNWPVLSRRTLVLFAIFGLHVLLIYCFANGLAQTIVRVIDRPLQTYFISEPKPSDVPPPPSAPTLVHPSLNAPLPDLTLNVAPEPGAIREPPAPPHEPTLVSTHPPLAVTRVMGGPDHGFPNTDDYYPTASRRLGETGSAVVRVCVDEQGRLTALPAVVRSSGSARLDEGAIRLARAGSGHYRPTIEDGRPVNSCYAFRITFTLRE
jgi:periplasmic protein TonB